MYSDYRRNKFDVFVLVFGLFIASLAIIFVISLSGIINNKSDKISTISFNPINNTITLIRSNGTYSVFHAENISLIDSGSVKDDSLFLAKGNKTIK